MLQKHRYYFFTNESIRQTEDQISVDSRDEHDFEALNFTLEIRVHARRSIDRTSEECCSGERRKRT